MPVQLGPAIAAGLIGGALMAVLERLPMRGRASASFDVLDMWSTLLALRGGLRLGALPIHLAVSAAIAVLYAVGFRIAGASDAGWAWGLAGALIHWLIAGTFLAGVPSSDDGSFRAPGRFAMNHGATGSLMFLAGHLLFGVVVGVAYFALSPGVTPVAT